MNRWFLFVGLLIISVANCEKHHDKSDDKNQHEGLLQHLQSIVHTVKNVILSLKQPGDDSKTENKKGQRALGQFNSLDYSDAGAHSSWISPSLSYSGAPQLGLGGNEQVLRTGSGYGGEYAHELRPEILPWKFQGVQRPVNTLEGIPPLTGNYRLGGYGVGSIGGYGAGYGRGVGSGGYGRLVGSGGYGVGSTGGYGAGYGRGVGSGGYRVGSSGGYGAGYGRGVGSGGYRVGSSGGYGGAGYGRGVGSEGYGRLVGSGGYGVGSSGGYGAGYGQGVGSGGYGKLVSSGGYGVGSTYGGYGGLGGAGGYGTPGVLGSGSFGGATIGQSLGQYPAGPQPTATQFIQAPQAFGARSVPKDHTKSGLRRASASVPQQGQTRGQRNLKQKKT